MAITHIFSNAIADGTNTNIVRPSDWNSAHGYALTLTGNAIGATTLSGTNILFGGSNNVTVSGVQGANAATINFQAPNVAAGNVNFSAGTTSNNLGAITFADSNGISWGLNGSTLTATVATNYQSQGAYLTTARASTDAIGLNTAKTNVTWTVNSSGLSLDAGGYAGTGFTTTTAPGATVIGTHDTAGLKLGVPAFLTTAMQSNAATISNINVSAGATSANLSALTFNNGNGVSFGLTNSIITATVKTDYLTTARASTDAVGLNTAKTNVTWTVNSSGISLDGGAYLTVQSNQTIGAYAVSNTTQSTSGTIDARSLSFNGAGIASVGITNGSVVISVPSGGGAGDGGVFAGISNLGNTAGTSGTISTGNFLFVGSNGITLSQSTAGGTAGTLTILHNAPGSWYENVPPVAAQLTVAAGNPFGQSTSFAQPFALPYDLSAAYIRSAFTMSTNSTTFGTTANTSFTGKVFFTGYAQIYTQMSGVSSDSYGQYTSASAGMTVAHSLTANSTNQYSVSISISYPITGGTSSFSTSYATTQTNFALSTNSLTDFTAIRNFDLPFATSLPASNYLMVAGMVTNNSTQVSAAQANFVCLPGGAAYFSGAVFGSAVADFGRASNATDNLRLAHGTISSNANPAGTIVGLSQISTINRLPYFQIIRRT